MKTLLIALVLIGGCARTGHAGLIVVDFDPEFETAMIKSDSEAQSAMPYLERGLRYWEPVGVTFATPEDVGAGDPEIDAAIKTYPHVRVKWAIDDTSSPFHSGDAGWYDGTTGDITLYMGMWVTGDHQLPFEGEQGLASIIAHELGHSMGLQHVADGKACMYGGGNYTTGIGAADVAEFERVTH